ncbi:MAG: GTP 3',8-cyclase MoaA [Acidobacteriota bacterium]|nr:GTP 3',8-cyclase MoaA [Acidobacteriota bacterium]
MVDPTHSSTHDPAVEPLRDAFRRPMTDLRISVTDRCNFRCSFCMPGDRRYHFLPRPEILTFEEVSRLAAIFSRLGVRKIRLTGGEPLLRSELETLVGQLAAIPGIDDLALTTNGYLLAEKAETLRAAGLSRVTVSFHSRDPETFARINGSRGGDDALQRVLDGLEAARRVGLAPIKLNHVPLRGINEHEIVDLARWAREQGYVLRFIEYMDVGTVNRWQEAEVLSAQEILRRIDREMPLEPVPRDPAGETDPGEVAERWRYRDGGGEVGVIASVTQPFCGDCSRVRLSAEGQLLTCLFATAGLDLKTPLRAGAADEELAELIAATWRRRTDRYSEERTEALRRGTFAPAEKIEMFRIGG